MNTDKIEQVDLDDGSGFTFGSATIDPPNMTEKPTILGLVGDWTGSMAGYTTLVRQAVVNSLQACKLSSASEHFRTRLTVFESRKGIQELVPFVQLRTLDPDTLPAFRADGGTPLYDATYEAVAAIGAEGERLYDAELSPNAVLVVATDGGESRGASRQTPAAIKDKISAIRRAEKLSSLLVIVVGINDTECKDELEAFVRDIGADQYVSIDNADPRTMAKLAKFIEASAVSASQSAQAGTPSQPVAF